MNINLAQTEEIIAELKAGRMVILVDGEDRENEGDLVVAAEFATPQAINFMATHGRGLICLTLTDERCRRLNLQQMVVENRTAHSTAFTVSIEAATGVTTGISAADRSCTVKAAVAPDATNRDLVQPGHIFPLRAQPGGVLRRAGHTEAGCDFSRLAGLEPAAVICEIYKDDGTMARLPDLVVYAKLHGLKLGTIADLISYRMRTEKLVERVGSRLIKTNYGQFNLIAYRETLSGVEHFAILKGDIKATTVTLVGVQDMPSAMEVLEVNRCGNFFCLNQALEKISSVGVGMVVLLQHPENQVGLMGRVMSEDSIASAKMLDTVSHGIAAQILKDAGAGKIRLLTTLRTMPSLVGFGLEVTGYESQVQEKLGNSNNWLSDRFTSQFWVGGRIQEQPDEEVNGMQQHWQLQS